MTPPTADELRAEIRRLGPWHHDMEIAPGVRTGEPVPPGTYPKELGKATVIRPDDPVDALIPRLYPDGMAGRSMLDCACNAGGFLFATQRHGGGRGFGFDVREHWIEQARFLSRHLPSENLQFEVRDLMSLPELGLQPFDMTLFAGILYHLPDPLAGLRIAADLTREVLIVNTDALPAHFDGLVLSLESTTHVMSGVHRLAWLPTSERTIREMLAWCGFPHARLLFDRPATLGRRRIAVVAAREASTFAHYDSLMPTPKPSRFATLAKRILRRLR